MDKQSRPKIKRAIIFLFVISPVFEPQACLRACLPSIFCCLKRPERAYQTQVTNTVFVNPAFEVLPDQAIGRKSLTASGHSGTYNPDTGRYEKDDLDVRPSPPSPEWSRV